MVNNRNLSSYPAPVPELSMANRGIAGGPIYRQNDVLALLDEHGGECLIAWTRDCINDLQKYEMESEYVKDLIRLCFTSGRFIGSEWCQQKTDGPWAACDAYQVTNRKWVKNAHKEMDFDNYIKFAIGKSGKPILLVSCHPPEFRW